MDVRNETFYVSPASLQALGWQKPTKRDAMQVMNALRAAGLTAYAVDRPQDKGDLKDAVKQAAMLFEAVATAAANTELSRAEVAFTAAGQTVAATAVEVERAQAEALEAEAEAALAQSLLDQVTENPAGAGLLDYLRHSSATATKRAERARGNLAAALARQAAAEATAASLSRPGVENMLAAWQRVLAVFTGQEQEQEQVPAGEQQQRWWRR